MDESAGSDETGDGTAEKSYASALGAMIAKGQDISIITRKQPTDEWAAITPTALKKAKKSYELHEKKMKKAADNKEKLEREAAEMKEREAKRLEESKKIQLVEDASLPPATKVS